MGICSQLEKILSMIDKEGKMFAYNKQYFFTAFPGIINVQAQHRMLHRILRPKYGVTIWKTPKNILYHSKK